MRMSGMSKKKIDKDAYHKALAEEVMNDLGTEIFYFRTLREKLVPYFKDDVPPDVLHLIDALYQTSLDSIFDGLANAKDLRVNDMAIDAIEKAMRVRRGFSKKADVL